MRWLLLPVSYFLAAFFGAMIWDSAGDYLDENYCSPDKWGEYYNGTVCFWPVWVSAVKDVLFAGYAAIIIVVIPTIVAPMVRYAIANSIAFFTTLLWIYYQVSAYHPMKHVVWHQILVGVVFVAVLFAACQLFRGDQFKPQEHDPEV